MDLKKSGGYTLIEVLGSIVILSIILISFYSFITQGFIFSAKNEDSLVSSNLANHVLETIQKNYTSSTCVNSPNIFTDYITFFEDIEDGGIKLNDGIYYINAELFCDDPSTDLPILQVKVYDSPSKTNIVTESFGYVNP